MYILPKASKKTALSSKLKLQESIIVRDQACSSKIKSDEGKKHHI
jgi:hypothetical protein